tara:strand:- start:672 stop:1088 length:417 start_codon:yes stop_codon:yes gene_type:complete
MKDLNFLGGKDITWIENNFEPIPKGYILGKDDVICDMSKMRTAKENNNRFAFFTNLSPYDKNANPYKGYLRYNYDIYDVEFDKNGKIVGSFRGTYDPPEKYPLFHSRYEYTLHHRNFYMFKQSIPEFMNWPNKTIEGL